MPNSTPEQMCTITPTVNGMTQTATVPVRKTLLDFIREDWMLTGSHAGCEPGVCGCCNGLLDGELVRSCILLAVQAEIREALAGNLCRCTGYMQIVEAVKAAAAEMQAQ